MWCRRSPLPAAAVAVVVVSSLVAPAAAQGRGGFPRPGGGAGRGGLPGFEGRPRAIDPVVLEGPPAPDAMAVLVALTDSQRPRYAALYAGFMDSTRALRDTLRITAERARDAFVSGDREAAKAGVEAQDERRRGLEKRLKTFDETLKTLLDQQQFKQYAHWRSERRKAGDERRERWRRERFDPS